MSRLGKPYATHKRNDSKTFQLTLNPSCGLPRRVCDEWKRRSFHNLPDELADHRNPKNGDATGAAAQALVWYLKKNWKKKVAHGELNLKTSLSETG